MDIYELKEYIKSTTDTYDTESLKPIKDKLSLETYKNINLALKKTIETGKEHGFSLCSNHEIISGDMCEGDECCIPMTLANSCPESNRHVLGQFHTHPNCSTPYGDIMASLRDLQLGLMHKLRGESSGIVCVAEGKNPEHMQCYIPKYNLDIPTDIILQILYGRHPQNIYKFLFFAYDVENIIIKEAIKNKTK